MSFDRYPRKQQMWPGTAGYALDNQITRFLKVQYLRNESKGENVFFLYAEISKEATNLNIIISLQTWSDAFKITPKVLSK